MKQYFLLLVLTMEFKTRGILSLLCMFIAIGMHAQFYPYNPYMNPGAQLGQQLGNAIAQKNKYGRNQLRKSINKWGECKNGSLSIEYGAVALYGRNGYFCSAAVDNRISSKLKSINKDGGTINDVVITENGNFIILYDDNHWYGVLPTGLKSVLDDYPWNTKFRSISFNESGTYAITTSVGFKSNNAEYQSFYDVNLNEYGELYSVNICGDGAVFCYSDGARFCGHIPNEVVSGIRRFSSTPKYVKFNKHGDYLICSASGAYSYSIADANAGSNSSTVFYDWKKDRMDNAQKKAYAKWDGKASYKYDEKSKTHSVLCNTDAVDGKLVTFHTSIKNNDEKSSLINITISTSSNDLDGIVTSSNEFFKNMAFVPIKIEMENGEVLSSKDAIVQKLSSGWFLVSIYLVHLHSDKTSLGGNIYSVKYHIGQFSTHNIKSITIKEKYKIDLSTMDTKSQLCYDFYRMAKESGLSNILPN